jgi:hypothetical protein
MNRPSPVPAARVALAGSLLAMIVLGWTASASAATLRVGQNQQYKMPSAAVAAAHDGDTISIDPGQYFDCAVVKQNNLTIEGSAAGAVITDKPCQGKALLVMDGNNITVRNLTLQRVRVPDSNGAGIRAEGGDLTIDNTHFLDNEDGILAAGNPQATITILNSEFVDNGKCDQGCAHGVYVGALKLLHIEHTRFFQTHHGHHIKSRASRTEVINCDISDGPQGNSSYLIDIPSGGSLVVENSRMEKGPQAENHAFAIIIGEEGVTQPTDELLIQNNTFTNDTGHPTVFVRNLTATKAVLINNVFKGGDIRPLFGDGTTR